MPPFTREQKDDFDRSIRAWHAAHWRAGDDETVRLAAARAFASEGGNVEVRVRRFHADPSVARIAARDPARLFEAEAFLTHRFFAGITDDDARAWVIQDCDRLAGSWFSRRIAATIHAGRADATRLLEGVWTDFALWLLESLQQAVEAERWVDPGGVPPSAPAPFWWHPALSLRSLMEREGLGQPSPASFWSGAFSYSAVGRLLVVYDVATTHAVAVRYVHCACGHDHAFLIGPRCSCVSCHDGPFVQYRRRWLLASELPGRYVTRWVCGDRRCTRISDSQGPDAPLCVECEQPCRALEVFQPGEPVVVTGDAALDDESPGQVADVAAPADPPGIHPLFRNRPCVLSRRAGVLPGPEAQAQRVRLLRAGHPDGRAPPAHRRPAGFQAVSGRLGSQTRRPAVAAEPRGGVRL
jgi:hypothetical protein